MAGVDPEDRDASAGAGDSEAEDEQASTPFDHPFFLPVLLWAFAAWFGWDIVTDAEAYQKYPMFNWGGLILTTPIAVYYTWRAVQERREPGRSDDAGDPSARQ